MRLASIAAAVVLCLPSGAAAEIAYFSTGRTLSVASHRVDGERVTFRLRGGGEMTCAADLIARIEPDEMPDPVAPAPAAVATGPSVALTGPYADLIATAARRHRVDPNLVHAVIRAESNYRAAARSRKGARGLMQLMPSTLRTYAVANAFDPASNIDAGTRYLRDLLDRFDLDRALAAYNAGAGAVRRHGGVPPFRETRDYVARVRAAMPVPPAAR